MSDLPDGWSSASLEDLCLPVVKHDPRSQPEVGFEYIDIGGIEAQQIVATKSLLGAEAPSRARQLVKAGDTLLSTVRTYLRKTALVPEALDSAIASTGFCVLRPGPAVHQRFLYYRVIEKRFVSALSGLQTGSSYPAVRDKDVLAQTIALPPLCEQRRIVAAIEAQFSRLDEAERSIAAATRRLGSLLALSVGTATQGGWNWVSLGAVTEHQAYGTSAKADDDPTGVPVLRMGNIQRGSIDTTALKYLPRDHPDVAKFTLAPGDLLFNRTNSPELVGKSAVFNDGSTPAIFASYLIRVRLNADCLPEWAALVINGPIGRSYVASVRTQQVGQANVNGTKLAAMEIPLPPVGEQRRIIAEVEERLSVIAAMRQAIDSAQRRSATLRRSILERAFRGELDPQDPTDEPASVLLERIRAEQEAGSPPRRRSSRRPARSRHAG